MPDKKHYTVHIRLEKNVFAPSSSEAAAVALEQLHDGSFGAIIKINVDPHDN